MVTRTSLLVVLTAASTVGSSPAHADKFTHDAHVAIDIKPTERSKPRQDRDEPPRPGINSDDALHLEGLLGEVHEEQITVLRGLIANTPDSEPMEKAELLFRLGELFAKLYRLHHLEAVKADIDLARAPAAQKPVLTKTAAGEAAKAKAVLLDAVRTYEALTTNPIYQPYPRMDVALFYYAYSLQSGGYLKEARGAYDKLLKDYPKSRYVPEAHLAFADYYFDTNRLADAEARYKRVLEFPASSVYWYAMYKLGWVAFNLSKFDQSLELFYQVVNGTKTDAAKANLHRSARKDFVRAYAEMGRADKALPAFRRVEEPKAFEMLETLADLYAGQGKSDKAIFVYRQLIVERPTSANVCAWEHAVAREMLTIGTPADRVHEIEQLAKLWVHLRDHKVLPKAEAEECRDSAAEMTGQLARMFHQEASKTKQLETYRFADRLYDAYLTTFPSAPDAPDTRYFRAELLWSRAELAAASGPKSARLVTQQWEDAAVAFTAALDAGGLDAKRIPIAADAAMLARMKALSIDPTVHEAPVTDAAYATKPAPRPLPASEQHLLAAFDGYLAHVKDDADSERVDVLFMKANLLRRFDHLTEAVVIFEQIVAKNPTHEAAETAAQLALDSYNRLQAYDQMLALAERLQANTKFMADKDGLRATVATLRRQSLRKSVAVLEATGKRTKDLTAFVTCAQKLVELYNMDALAADADELLYDAGVCFEEGRSMGAAASMFQQVQKLFPKSKLAARALARLGNVYAQIAFYREASEKFEEYATKYGGEKDAFDALSDAVTFRKGIGDDAKAIEDTKTFVRMFGAKQRTQAATAFWSLGAIYEKQGDLEQIARHYRAYLTTYGDLGGADRTVIAWSKIGQALWQHACPVKTVDGACVRVVREAALGKTIHLAATAIPKQCGDDTKLKLTVVPRDERDARAALAAFDHAIAEWTKRGGTVGGDQQGARYHVALAKLGRIDRDYETYLALPLPANLDFDKRKPAIARASQQRFDTWFTGKRALGATLRKHYEEVIAMNDGATTITSAARLGQISQGFSGQLFRAEIPADVRSGPYAEDTTTAYCDALTTLAEPLEADALRSYQGCLVTSTRLGWFSDWSRLCERELGQLQPESWPTVAELRPQPEHFSAIRDVEPPKLTAD